MENLYAFLSAEPNELELRNRALARAAAAEGFVLLKNENGALPLKSKKLALYGIGARKTVKGGLGSGSVNERYSVSIEDGLKNAGYEISTQHWLDDYDAEYDAAYQSYRAGVEAEIAGLTNPMEIFAITLKRVFRFPSGRPVTQADIAESRTDTAIYVLTRQAGEGKDRHLEAGDYYLTDVEKENLKLVASGYARTIVGVNVGGLMDFGFLDEIPGIDAVVLFSQGGEEGGNALADVLSGEVNFSGKLTDTVPMCYEDIPFGKEFGYLSGDLDNSYYREGIYVGYRYYDSFSKAVRWPFGYGLSYTSFAQKTVSAEISGEKVALAVSVTNTGAAAGKEVVQLYVSAPDGACAKEYQRLAAFGKTGLLAPGQQETVRLSFRLSDCASFDETESCWKLDAGDYLVRVGADSAHTEIAAVVRLEQTVITQQCRACCAPTDELPIFAPEKRAAEAIPADAHILTVPAADIPAETVIYQQPGIQETAREKEILDGLTPEEQVELLKGGALRNPPAGSLEIQGATGKTSTALLHKGIRNIILTDGPAGVNICGKLKRLPNGKVVASEVPEQYNWGPMAAHMRKQLASLPGNPAFRYATAWPVEILLAQNWNTALLEQVGKAVGEEMIAFGVSVWLAPGMNIHRNPLGGRTFEYYSEDPLLTGKLAAALTRGVQSNPGAAVSVKHFCCNNIEDNRNGMSANLSQRALREIYLKGFEIVVRESSPATVMSSYNRVNHVYNANSPQLLNDILRCEWGFRGLVMTDWDSCNATHADPALCPVSGNDLIMPGSDYDKQRILEALKDGSVTSEQVRLCACRVLRLLLTSATPVLIQPVQ